MRIGIGYDVHRLEQGRPLVLGGARLDYEKGLAGHSDGDVLTHAIMDALLGAAGLPDIGVFFPPDDPRYAGAPSTGLLSQVWSMLSQRGFSVGNIDATVIAERPRIADAVPTMRERLAAALGLEPHRIGIKATTNEGLGFLGRGEGIAALAVALVQEDAGA